MIKFSAKYLPALMKFMAKKDIRYYLMGIHIEPDPKGGAILVATDGHRMLVIKDKTAQCSESAIFSIQRGIERFCKDDEGYATICQESQRLTIFSGAGKEVFLQPEKCLIVGSKFPDWKRVMPDFTKLEQKSMSFCKPEYLADAVLVHPGNKSRIAGYGCRVWAESENSSVIVEYSGHPEYVAIIMPLRCELAIGSTAGWMQVFGNPKVDLLSQP
jgi:DNA polymerase III sliding clamp (beta) subunit (PCNA family)